MKIVVDVETTGLCCGFDRILELAICDLEKNVLFNERFKPGRRKKWPEAQAINHISPEDVKDKKQIRKYRKEIMKILMEAEEIIGYNVMFDVDFLASDLDFSDEEWLKLPKCYDVMQDFAEVYGQWNDYFESYTWQKLTTAASYYEYHWNEEEDAHGALADVLATIHVYHHMMKEMEEKKEKEENTKRIQE